MKNIQHILLFALMLSAAPALLPAQCNNYTCKMELARKALKKGEYKSALDHARGAENYDASKKATVNLFIDEVFAAIEQKKKDAEEGEKKVKKALKEAEAAKALAEAAEKKTSEALVLVEAEKQNALTAKVTAEAAEKKATAVLDKIYFYKDRFGLAYDKTSRRYGFIDKNLTTKVDFKYTEALPFEDNGFAKVKRYNDRSTLMDFFIDTLGNEYPLVTEINQISPEITALDLRNKELTEIPDTVLKSVQLKVLLLSGNRLNILPAEIGGLKNLTTLYLYSNKLSSLPAEIGGLKNLTTLNLENNQFRRLPTEIKELKNLITLDLTYNRLRSLPAQIGELKNLTYLDLRSNQLSSLPVEIWGLKNLTTLALDDNQLSSLPVEIWGLKNLTTLALDDNQLSSLPAEIGGLKNLTYLNLDDNQLSSLPAEIGELKSLQSLYLSGNNLKGLPIEALRNMTSLQRIALARFDGTNPLPETAVSALRAAMPWCEIKFDPSGEKNQTIRERYEQEALKGEAQIKSNPDDTAFQKKLAKTYNWLAVYQLLTGQFLEAEASINRGLTLDSTNVYLPTNLAPALLLQGKTTEALQEYKKWKDLLYGQDGLPFYRDAFLSDLNGLESAGVIPEARKGDVEAVRALLRKE